LRLTTALYYTPSGRSIQGQGINPDVVVSLPKSEQVANAVLSHESDLYRALKNTGSLTASAMVTPVVSSQSSAETTEHPIKPLIIGTAKDAQLETAVDYLQRAVRRDAGARPG
jgi:carboxyl-terminal processing protease